MSNVKVIATGDGRNHLLLKGGESMYKGTVSIDVPDLKPENALEWAMATWDLFYKYAGEQENPALGFGYEFRGEGRGIWMEDYRG